MRNERETVGLEQLLAAPVGAIHHAQAVLSELSLDFVAHGFETGSDGAQQAITRSYVIPRRVASVSGEVHEGTLRVDIPILALMPIPSLCVDETSTTMSAEVVQSRDSGSVDDAPELRCTPAATAPSRRNTDRSPRADMELRLKSGPPSEGVSRLLDRLNDKIGVRPAKAES